jgi:hypothetical protein
MTLRRPIAVLLFALLGLPGTASAANFSTTNFVVSAPDEQLARRFGEMAEFYRREKAMEWLGQEMPAWPRRCPLRVEINGSGAGGATTFNFGTDAGRSVVTERKMEIRGDVKQLLNSVLPHEITHTVLAEHFGRPVPRWADEGGSVLSENDEERYSHDIRCRDLLNGGRGIRLRVLFRMTEYPRDMIVLYAQGYSITAYLVERGGGGLDGRQKLLRFLGEGMNGNTPAAWDGAAQRVYGAESIDTLETKWLDSLRTPPSRVAARGAVPGATLASAGGTRTDVRTSAPPAVPLLEPPVKAVRGATPNDEPARPAFPTGSSPVSTPVSKPAVLPDIPPPDLLAPPELPKR